jgi:tetratricopeptide (TPR) repeat protein
VVQIAGPAGAGKSRLVHEFIKGLRQSGRQLAIWSAHGESIRQESPLGVLAELLRQAMQISATAAALAQRERIRTCVAERVAPEHLHRVASFVGEIMGVRFPDSDNVQLREARRDPAIMRDLMQQAWEEFLAAEADGWPVILLLEDLQWSDRASLRFIDMTLRSLEGRAVLVLAMALPDSHERFPNLWAEHPVDYIHLGPLSQRACLELARQVLPEPVGNDALAGLVERCGGNPFYLEELLRATASKHTDELPDAVLVMVSARLRALSPAERRALRAASVFGTDFWVGGVAALLEDEPAEVSALMNHLCDREFVVSHRRSRFEGQAQYGFHHDLLRDAAYASLTDEDRIQAHRGAGEWLEDMGESDAAILAEHYWRGKAFASALPCYRRAAEHALGAEDLDAVIHLAQRAVDCGASGEVLGALHALQAEARNWLMEPELAMQLGLEAMKRLSAGGDAWAGACHHVIWAASSLFDAEQMVQTARQLIEHMPERPSDEYLASLAYPALHLRMHLRESESRVMVGVMRAHLRTRKPGPLLAANLAHMNGLLLANEGKLDLAVTVMKLSVESWTELGSLRHACLDRGNLGSILCALGRYEDGIDELWSSVARARRADFTAVRGSYESMLALALARTGAVDEAGRLFDELPEAGPGRSQDIFQRICRARFELLAGRPQHASRRISKVLEQLAGTVSPHQHALARSVAAQALLALGQPRPALDEARAGLAAIGAIKGLAGEGEVPLRLVYAEALHASGHEAEASGAIVEARRRLLERAGHIANLEMRQSFLDRVAENRRTLELAAAWQKNDSPDPG